MTKYFSTVFSSAILLGGFANAATYSEGIYARGGFFDDMKMTITPFDDHGGTRKLTNARIDFVFAVYVDYFDVKNLSNTQQDVYGSFYADYSLKSPIVGVQEELGVGDALSASICASGISSGNGCWGDSYSFNLFGGDYFAKSFSKDLDRFLSPVDLSFQLADFGYSPSSNDTFEVDFDTASKSMEAYGDVFYTYEDVVGGTIPLPAGFPLLLVGIGALALAARGKKRM